MIRAQSSEERLLVADGTIADLGRIVQFVAERGRQLTSDARFLLHVQLAVDEISTNIFEHGYGGRPGDLELVMRPEGPHLLLVVRDWGPPFDPTTEPLRSSPTGEALPTRPPGGYGLRIVRGIAEELHYRREAGVNELRLAIRLPEPAP